MGGGGEGRVIFKFAGEEGRVRGIFLVILRRKFFQGWGGERSGPTLPPSRSAHEHYGEL